MLYRSIYIGNPTHLKLKDKQLKITDPTTQTVKGSVPIEDLGLLMLDHYQITVSHQLLQELMKNNVVLISCDEKHLPLGAMLPFSGNTQYSERVKTQLEVSEPLKKQLWKQTVECKIQNQAKVLEYLGKYADPMYDYLKEVKSGDTTNMEGIAAQHYWKYLIDYDFLRDVTGLIKGIPVIRLSIYQTFKGKNVQNIIESKDKVMILYLVKTIVEEWS